MGLLERSKYHGPPSDELDKLWESLYNGMHRPSSGSARSAGLQTGSCSCSSTSHSGHFCYPAEGGCSFGQRYRRTSYGSWSIHYPTSCLPCFGMRRTFLRFSLLSVYISNLIWVGYAPQVLLAYALSRGAETALHQH